MNLLMYVINLQIKNFPKKLTVQLKETIATVFLRIIMTISKNDKKIIIIDLNISNVDSVFRALKSFEKIFLFQIKQKI